MHNAGLACFGAVIGWVRASRGAPTGRGGLLVHAAVIAATIADAVLVAGAAAVGPVVFGLVLGWLAGVAFRKLITIRARTLRGAHGH